MKTGEDKTAHAGTQTAGLWSNETIEWLLAGDVAIQYQVWRDLLGEERPDLQARIATEGWGARFLAARHPSGIWGRGFYAPKWTSSHYTLLDLRLLNFPRDHPAVRASVDLVVRTEKRPDGGIGPGKTMPSDVCVNGMYLNYACWFGQDEQSLQSIVDFLIGQHMADGGFNCESTRRHPHHSSLHSSLSVLEGIAQYAASGYRYRLDELTAMAEAAREFILIHRLYRSDRTGEVIDLGMLKLPFPPRYRFNLLRGLDYFSAAGVAWDPRMADALGEVVARRRADGRWPVNFGMAGQEHFRMEKPGQPSRWITLIALRVLKAYRAEAGGAARG